MYDVCPLRFSTATHKNSRPFCLHSDWFFILEAWKQKTMFSWAGDNYKQCGGSGMFIPDPDFYPSRIPDPRIPDPKTATTERGEKNFCCHIFLCSQNFHKIVNFLVLKCWRKKLGQFSKNYRTFYQKNGQKALKNMVLGFGIRDPGSGKNLFRIPDPGVKKAPDPGSGSATLTINQRL